mgnify:CR=1 FL=1
MASNSSFDISTGADLQEVEEVYLPLSRLRAKVAGSPAGAGASP